MKKFLIPIFILSLFNFAFAESSVPIKMTVGDIIVTAVLNGSKPSHDLLAKLPLTILMTRWGEREYYGKTELSKEGVRRSGFESGDVMYWATGGSFAIFYDNTKNTNISDLIVMWKVTSDLNILKNMPDPVSMLIEKHE